MRRRCQLDEAGRFVYEEIMRILRCLGQASILLIVSTAPAAAAPIISEATTDANGFLVHSVECEYQKGPTELRVLLPEKPAKGARYPVVYVLPVEAKNGNRFGDGLLEIKKLDLANKQRAIFVAPTFSHLPWYADHPSDGTIRQESYFLKVVVPFVDKTYPTIAEAGGRHLLGFSKSGWGAWSLLLRHPDLFGKAAAWDAPLMKEKPDQFGMGEIFGSQENFAKYQITKLVQNQGNKLGASKRLILLGIGNFRDHHLKMHALLEEKKVPHEYTDGPVRKHDWHSGWVVDAAAAMFKADSKDR
jgi:S-formylglutathione hydrolase FrmB